jgi:hypothetical protein
VEVVGQTLSEKLVARVVALVQLQARFSLLVAQELLIKALMVVTVATAQTRLAVVAVVALVRLVATSLLVLEAMV